MTWQMTVLALLSASLFRPLLLAAAAVVVVWIFRVEHPASRHAIWTAVLVGMLLIPAVSVMSPHWEFRALPQGTFARFSVVDPAAPDIHQEPEVRTDVSGEGSELSELPISASSGSSALDGPQETTGVEESAVPGAVRFKKLELGAILVGIYLIGCLAQIGYRMAGWLLLWRLVARSRSCGSGFLRESTDVAVPLVAGIFRPAVILPTGWRDWSAVTRRAVLAHEFAHLRRRDPQVALLARVVKCLLWFHPLAWIVSRKVSELAEMACDAVALDRVGDAAAYSRMLVDFAGILSRRRFRASLPGLAMVGRSRLECRIDQVHAVAGGKRRRLARPAVVLILIGLPSFGGAATLGLTESSARPLQQVEKVLSLKLESAAQVARTSGIVAAIAGVVPPLGTLRTEPTPQSASSVKAFVDQYCVRCHGRGDSWSRLTLADLDYGNIRSDAAAWEKVIGRFRAGMEPNNRGGPTPTVDEFRSVVEWLESELDRDAPLYAPAPGPHRLNRTEYANAIQDVLGLEVNPSLLLPADDSNFGFDNIARTLQPIPSAVYATAAERVVEVAFDTLATRQRMSPCPAETSEDVDGCTQHLIESVAARAFRRPLTTTEAEALVDLYKTRPDPLCCLFVDRGTRAVLQSILTDDRFLYRTETEPRGAEVGQAYRISDLELASRLSYFLWSRGPDEQLLTLAIRGQLHDPVVLESETRRMLKDPRAIALTTNFASQWLNLRGLKNAGPMPSYPGFDEELLQAMRKETELFFASIVQEDRDVLDLLTADYTFLNERLAAHYGIPNVRGPEFRRVALGPEFDMRRGLLGKAALLTVTSRADRTSLTTRSLWVQRVFLGVAPPPPPPNVSPLGPITAPMRVVMEKANSANQSCVDCHRLIDPIGIALDNFDQAGKWRTTDKGLLIDASTELVDGTRIDGPRELRDELVSHSDQFLRTLTQKLLICGLGRGVGYQDMPVVRSVVREAARDSNRFSAIVVAIVKSPVFQMNSKN